MNEFAQNDQSVNTQFNIGRDQIIHNLVLVGQFLDFTKIEELIPKSSTPNEFDNIADAFENIVTKDISTDFTQAIAFAGEILSGVINKWTPTKPYQTLPIKTIFRESPKLIVEGLIEFNYWEVYSVSENGTYYLPLPSLSLLWKKNFNSERFFAIKSNYDHNYCTIIFKTNEKIDWGYNQTLVMDDTSYEVSYKIFQIVMAGMAIDLMRIYTKGTDSVKFWNSFIEKISTRPK